MAPAGLYAKAPADGAKPPSPASVDEGRLDPGLQQFATTCAAPPAMPTYLVLGLPICFTVALGILLIGFRGALTLEAIGFLALGAIGLVALRSLNRES
jgi:hypothetical protein